MEIKSVKLLSKNYELMDGNVMIKATVFPDGNITLRNAKGDDKFIFLGSSANYAKKVIGLMLKATEIKWSD